MRSFKKWIKRKVCCLIMMMFVVLLIGSNCYSLAQGYKLGKDKICTDVHFYIDGALKINGCGGN